MIPETAYVRNGDVHIAYQTWGEGDVDLVVVPALAQSNEVVVSRTVKDLVAGSRIRFESRGMHTLRGVPDEWEILAVVG